MSTHLLFVLGQPASDWRQGPAGHAAGPDQHPVCALQPQRAAGSAAHHPLLVVWRAGEDEDPGGALQTLLQLRQVSAQHSPFLHTVVENITGVGTSVLNWSSRWFGLLRYDEEHSADDKVFLDCFCKIAAGIKNNSNGHQLKDLILQKGITQNALDYMKKHIPDAKK